MVVYRHVTVSPEVPVALLSLLAGMPRRLPTSDGNCGALIQPQFALRMFHHRNLRREWTAAHEIPTRLAKRKSQIFPHGNHGGALAVSDNPVNIANPEHAKHPNAHAAQKTHSC